jgi:hypothetical protein
LLSARKIVKLLKYPMFMPSVWHVDAYATWWCGSSVSAQPSTATSCVAASSTKKKKSAVSGATAPAS